MITFKKINEVIADAYYNNEKVGHIEKLYNGYNVEINYVRTFLSYDNTKMVVDYANKLFKRLEARKRRELKPLRNFNEFKILE